MLFENTIVLSENGLELNINNYTKTYSNITDYILNNNKVLFYNNSSVCFFDLSLKQELCQYKIENIKTIKMSGCTKLGGALTFSKTLHISNYKNIIYTEEGVDNFYISTSYLITQKDDKINIYKNFELVKSLERVRNIFLEHDKLFLTVKKSREEKPNLIFYDLCTMQNVSVHIFDHLENLQIKARKDYNYFLLSIVTENESTAYYNKPCLYLYDVKGAKLQHIKIANNPVFFDFLENGILIIHGDQPCNTAIYNFNLELVKTFPNGTWNRGYFNIHSNLVCFAGFDNLSGNIEVYSNELLAKFKVLGASKIIWSCNGSYFIVAVTNKLKVDNKVQVYDYHGRLIKEVHYKNLMNVDWIGEKGEFIELEKPDVKNITVESTYVPPHLRKKNVKKTTKKRENPKIAPGKEKIDVRLLEKELKEIEELKKRVGNGEILEIGDLNKILGEGDIKKQLELNK